MSDETTTSTRRAFFLNAGAALGTGVAATVSASALASSPQTIPERAPQDLRRELDREQARAAIRKLQLDFAACIEQEDYERAVELFDEGAHLDLSGTNATGKRGIRQMFESQHRGQTAQVVHGAYRQNASQQCGDVIAVSEDVAQGDATFHVDARLSTPLPADCTAAQMARLQGNVAEQRWETGRLEGRYTKRDGVWKIAALTYRPAR